MKKYFIYAASALALASCSSDDFLGDNPGNEQNASSAINFGGETGKTTRAANDKKDGEAAGLLDNNFVVVGFKGEGKTAANHENYAFDHYNVNYVANTANTTESNTANWEYVNQKMEVKGASGALAEKAKQQTIKYWDRSCATYDFFAFSMGKGYNDATTTNYATPTQVKKDQLATAAYTLTGDVNTLSECYISDMKTVKKANYKKDAVKMQFRHLTSKVRIALFETVPGYVISDVKFHDAAYDVAAATTPSEQGTFYGTFNKKGKVTVSFPTTGTDNETKSDYNKAHVSFAPDADGTEAKKVFGNVNYKCQAEDQIAENSTYLSQSAATPSYCGTETYYQKVLPAETNSQPINLRIDYKLTATDGSGEEINVKNATATVPAEYAAWKHGYAYTYIFNISQNTNGTTGTPGTDDKGLTAISFNAVVLDDEETGKQETITTVSTPSITTYGFKDGKVTVNGNEYATGTDIYATVFVPATTTPAPGTTATTVAPNNLYTVTIEANAAQTINEASVANALVNGTKNDPTNPTTWTVTDANGKKMVVTKSTEGSEVPSVPTEDGKTLSVKALKWTAGTAGTIYAVEYAPASGTKAYKIVKVTE